MLVRVEGKRRLPLLPQAGDEAGDGSARPSWQWVVLGALAIFVVWVPLAASTASIAARLAPAGRVDQPDRGTLLFAGLSSLALAIAALAGGFVVGKARGTASASRDAALSGLAAASVAVVGSWVALGFNVTSLVAAAIAVAFATVGGKIGGPRGASSLRARAKKR